MTDRIERLRRLLESDPSDPFCLYALGMEYASADEPARAIAHLEQSLRENPDQPWAFFHIARCRLATGDRSGASAAVSDGLELAQRTGDESALADLQTLQDQCRD